MREEGGREYRKDRHNDTESGDFRYIVLGYFKEAVNVEEGEEGLKEPERSRTPQENIQNQLTDTHGGSPLRLKQQAEDLPGPLCIYYSSQLSIFTELLSV